MPKQTKPTGLSKADMRLIWWQALAIVASIFAVFGGIAAAYAEKVCRF
jgi:hypothetical protein